MEVSESDKLPEFYMQIDLTFLICFIHLDFSWWAYTQSHWSCLRR